MSWTLRKSKKIGPVRITASKRGLSASSGVPGLRMSANTRGEVRRTVGIPGTGVYNTKRVGGKSKNPQGVPAPDESAGFDADAWLALQDGLEQMWDSITPESQRQVMDNIEAHPVEVREGLASLLREVDPTASDGLVDEFFAYAQTAAEVDREHQVLRGRFDSWWASMDEPNRARFLRLAATDRETLSAELAPWGDDRTPVMLFVIELQHNMNSHPKGLRLVD